MKYIVLQFVVVCFFWMEGVRRLHDKLLEVFVTSFRDGREFRVVLSQIYVRYVYPF